MYRKSILIAAAIVAAGALLVAFDPQLMAAYRSAAPEWETLNALADWIRHVDNRLLVLAFVALYVALTRVERGRRLAILAGTLLTQATVVSLLKKLFSRPRPAEMPEAVAFFGLRWHDAYDSFPSGHTAYAFALATVLAAWHPRWRWAFYAGAFVVAWSRVHLDRHFVGDCFIGGWLGFFIARCFVLYLGRRKKAEAAEQDSTAGRRTE